MCRRRGRHRGRSTDHHYDRGSHHHLDRSANDDHYGSPDYNDDDYPASDLNVAEGTPIYAAHPGTVTATSAPCADTSRCRCGWGVHVAGDDGHTYTYCHGSRLADHIGPGVTVIAGQLIMISGNTGNSTAPHLHFQIRNPQGDLICPQGPLEAWWNGVALSPTGTPDTGCTH